MGIRIEKIKINQNGPLNSNFELEPRDLNLIYGYNETGKTYIVEAMIQFLFKNRKYPLTLRDWDFGGKIMVSGIEQTPVSFKKTGAKLDNYTDNKLGLPKDIGKLLVVRSGETRFIEKGDGVGREIIRNCLSGKGILEEILKPIQTNNRKLEIENKTITGPLSSNKRDLQEIREERNKLDILISEIENSDSLAEISRLEEEEEKVSGNVENLKKAKRSYAFELSSEIKQIDDELNRLPKLEGLRKVEQKISDLNQAVGEKERLNEEYKKRAKTSDDYKWCIAAQKKYNEGLAEQGQTKDNKWMMILGILSVLSALAFLLPQMTLPAVLCIVAAGVLLVLYGVTKRQINNQGFIDEQKQRENEFKKRFGIELTGKDILDSKLAELQKNNTLAQDSKRKLEEQNSKISNLRTSIVFEMKNLFVREVNGTDWIAEIDKVKSSIEKYEIQRSELNDTLLPLNVPPSDYLQAGSAVKWNSTELIKQEKQLDDINQRIVVLENEMNDLKGRIAAETAKSYSESIEDLMDELYKKKQQVADKYRIMCSETLAMIKVVEIVNELTGQEDMEIKDNLSLPAITNLLSAITGGKYTDINMDDNGSLSLITGNDEEYPLSLLSKGAREQIYLALRAGFAERVLKNPAFLILDDAFQHSDYERRKNLVEHTMRLVDAGWQIFYFTMDDHMKHLFEAAGNNMKGDFKNISL